MLVEKTLRLLVVSAVLGSQAQADCAPNQQVFSSCQIENRKTEVFVCFDSDRAIYAYGPIGAAPELILSEPIETVEFEPWSGVTREIGEAVTFYNGDYSYRVVGGFERLLQSDDDLDENGDYDAKTRSYGWVEVALKDKPLLRLECIPETVGYGFGGGIYDLKVALGQSWDDRARRWVSGQ
jgi:hypothetical protein